MNPYVNRWEAALGATCAVCGAGDPNPDAQHRHDRICALGGRNPHFFVPALAQPLDVYVPTQGRDRMITQGSGIVGRVQDNGLLCYYQEPHGERSNIRTWADCCHHAAGRLIGEYPTTAFRVVEPIYMTPVGHYNGYRIRLLPGDEARGKARIWLGFDPVLRPDELERSE